MPTAEAEFQRQFVAEMLTARAGELADRAARDLVESEPDLAAAYRPSPKPKWQEHYLGRITDLAAAVWAGKPEVIGGQVAWGRAAFAARGVPTEHLRRSLLSLGRTLAREVPPEDAPLLRSYIEAAAKALDAVRPDNGDLPVHTAPGQVAARYLAAVLSGRRLEGVQIVLDAVKSGLSVREAYLDVLLAAQAELGRLWHMGELSIAEEHFATATTQMVLPHLLLMADREPHDGRVALVASVRSNTHDLGPRILGDLLEIAGWRTICLGGDVPPDDLVTACVDFGVHLVALSACMPPQLRCVEEAIAVLRRGLPEPGPRILVGGRAFDPCPDLWSKLGADGYAKGVADAVNAAAKLVPRP